MGIQIRDFDKAQLAVKRLVPRDIAKSCQSKRPKAAIARIDLASANKACSDTLSGIPRVHIHFDNMQFTLERLGQNKSDELVFLGGDKTMPFSDQPLARGDRHCVGSSGSCFPIRLLEQASGCLLYIGHG